MMKKRIFVVERDPDILHIVTVLLTEREFEVISFSTEHEVFDKMVALKPHAVLLDIIRPTDAGTELCRAIKEADTTHHIPVIVLSTHPKASAVKDICADEVIAKPFDIDLLIETLEEHLLA